MTTLEHQSIAELIYLELKETPLTIGELSQTLNLPMVQVSHVIKDMPDKYPICTENGKYFIPRESPAAWLGTFIIFLFLSEVVVKMI